jgi:hypothetical protein
VIRRALALAALALAVPVLAQAAADGSRADARVPSAQLQASGSGAMTIAGRMVVHGTIPEQGRVVVIDRRGDARAYLAGAPLEFKRRRAMATRASGILFVTGSNVSVQVLGVDLSFSIAGNGQARLMGTGTYRLNSEPERSWTRAVIRVSPSSDRRRGQRRAERPARATCAACPPAVVRRR